MSSIRPDLTVAQLAAIVSETLKANGIPAVLSGGSVVSIYSDNQYQSRDLDFVTLAEFKRIAAAMNKLGFVRSSGRHFEHPNTSYFVEFPSGPLTLGNEFVQSWAELSTEMGVLQILSPTQCVSDRQGLDQALMVALRHSIDLLKIEPWSDEEQQRSKFQEFRSLVVSRST